jgi:hypothetical protein
MLIDRLFRPFDWTRGMPDERLGAILLNTYKTSQSVRKCHRVSAAPFLRHQARHR